MRKLQLTFALALLASLTTIAPASAQREDSQGYSGRMALSVHAHSSEHTNTLFSPTNPLETSFGEGDQFSYSSIPCERPAPFNDRSLSFNPDYPGIEDPASTRHLVEGTITDVNESGKRGTIEGTITTILCVNGDESQNTITTAYEGRFVRTSDNTLRIVGRYQIAGGSGVFAGAEGTGKIRGQLTCLPRTLEATGAESCEDLGHFADAVFRLRGTFSDPTVPTG